MDSLIVPYDFGVEKLADTWRDKVVGYGWDKFMDNTIEAAEFDDIEK